MEGKLLELVDRYKELRDKKDELAEQVKANNAELENVTQQLAQQMIDDEVPNISRGGFKYILSNKVIYSKRNEADLAKNDKSFFDFLREEGLGDLVKETVDSRTLSSSINSLVEEVGELPEHYSDYITSYEKLDIQKRKDTSKAIKNN